MIKVIFPPGCYGNFLIRCIYKLTSLGPSPEIKFLYDEHGSSHSIRYDHQRKSKIQCGHINEITFDPNTEDVIVILPDSGRKLEYLDNQYLKQEKGNLVAYLSKLFGNKNRVLEELKKWGRYSDITEVPAWVIREWCSFWLPNTLDVMYQRELYAGINSVYFLETKNLCTNLESILQDICLTLNLNIVVTTQDLCELQYNFLSKQKSFDVQEKCEKWVQEIINDSTNGPTPCNTIFDEAYVQHLLRRQGFEIRCDGLAIFPDSAKKMKEIIYK